MDRIQPLRIMAGHLSDVDVSFNIQSFFSCVCPNFLQILYHLLVNYNFFNLHIDSSRIFLQVT